MATVSHYIYSDYRSEDRELLEVDSGQHNADADIADPWLTEGVLGFNKRIANPPKFVAATIDYDSWASTSSISGPSSTNSKCGEMDTIGEWYRSLSRKASTSIPRSSTPVSKEVTQDTQVSARKAVKKDKSNWFIFRALEASTAQTTEGSQSPSRIGSPSISTPTLADILARDPPPLPSESRYTPPVWLSIGPGNKGFAMLQKYGWEEGEALGRAARTGLGYKGKSSVGKFETLQDAGKEIIDLSQLDEEIIDLTGIDDDHEDDNVFVGSESSSRTHSYVLPNTQEDLDHEPRALLTPLPTILKADRLGIGLKAKTVGSGLYRAPVRRVTHSQASLAAHINAGNALRHSKKVTGRGTRGFERSKRKDEEGRRNLLGYLNS